ncbi:hypothetical protein FIM04_03230 [SAR202 cluster bacterium AC-409-J13_OGT_754m]|nr:hypothetical protein [SAR202 cluster bacterium AC-409-J13_OGT_754m]
MSVEGQKRGDLPNVTAVGQATVVLKAPHNKLATFGMTKVEYYVVTDAIYQDANDDAAEAVIRKGFVSVAPPAVVTPGYMRRLEGFGEDALNYFTGLAQKYGSNSPGLLYRYSNDHVSTDIVEGKSFDVAKGLTERLESSSDQTAVIIGIDNLWDICLLQFVFEFTMASIENNIRELGRLRLIDPEPGLGVPRAAIKDIELLFVETSKGNIDPSVLKIELDRWQIFDRYQDRFLALFRNKS